MKKAIRIAALLLCVAMAAALSGCFGKEDETGDTTPTTTEVTTTQPTAAPTTAGDQPFTGYVNATTLRVRSSADTSGEPIGGLVFGDTVSVIGREGDWYKITFKDGVGYVSAQYIQDTMPTVSTTTETTTDPSATATDSAAATDTTVVAAP